MLKKGHAAPTTWALPKPAVFFAKVEHADLSAGFHPHLSVAEQQRADRFRFPIDRTAFCAAHYLLRTGLDLIAGPEDWRFESNDQGKPYLHPDCAKGGLEFNLTHSRTHVACAFSYTNPVGVDTEDDYAAPDILEVAARVCSEGECTVLSRLDERSRRRSFARLWTAKEALAKASGRGLGLDLTQFPIDLAKGTFGRGGEALGEPAFWKIEHCLFGESHFAAAIHSTDGRANAIAFDWYHVRLEDLVGGLGGAVAGTVTAIDRTVATARPVSGGMWNFREIEGGLGHRPRNTDAGRSPASAACGDDPGASRPQTRLPQRKLHEKVQ